MTMRRTRKSSTDLAWMVREELRGRPGCPEGVSLAVVPAGKEWTVVVAKEHEKRHPACVKVVRAIERRLRRLHLLTTD